MGRGLIAWATLEAPHGSLSLSRLPSFQEAETARQGGSAAALALPGLRRALRRPTG